jgi:ribonucleoside-diphosphate reductase alpha chain
MDCETTGVEPEASLYKVKHLVGGGTVVIENRIVDTALESLGYAESERSTILKWLADKETLEGCPSLRIKDLPVFDCAIPSKGKRSLSVDAHLKMTAAVQPFLSGAISKTMNMPNNVTPTAIGEAFQRAWKLGLKSTTIYRNGCKKSQPLVTSVDMPVREKEDVQPRPVRRRLKDHQTNVHRIKFRFGEVKGYLIVTPYEDTGLPGEIFIEWSKEGSTISGLVDGWAQSISYNLQFGVPLETLVSKFAHTKFEPSGFSPDPDIKNVSSIYDFVMRKLAAIFLDTPVSNGHSLEKAFAELDHTPTTLPRLDSTIDNPACTICGTLMERSGANCFKCPLCGTAPGCG